MKELTNKDIVALWLLRLLCCSKISKVFVRNNHFRDDDVAYAIGMDKWVDNDDFEPEQVRSEMYARLEVLESRYKRYGYNAKVRGNFQVVQNLLCLSQVESEVLCLVTFSGIYDALRDGWNILDSRIEWTFERFAAQCLSLPHEQVKAALANDARLTGSGLCITQSFRGTKIPALFSESLCRILLESSVNAKGFYGEILHLPESANLAFKDFHYLNPSLQHLRTYLRVAIREARKGVNILLHGPPGTGKTQLSRLLAKELRCPGYEVRTETASGEALSPEQHFARLRLANRLIAGRSLLMVDEAEDIFSNDRFDADSPLAGHKGLLHRMLESNPVPIIWITNCLSGFDPANIRRFDSVLNVSNPPPGQRARVIRRICGPALSKDFVRRLSKAEDLSPAVVARTHRFANTVCAHQPDSPNRESVMEAQIQSTLKAQRFDPIPTSLKGLPGEAQPLPKLYDPTYVNTPSDLLKLADTLKAERRGRLCIYGPPGTGKTSYAHHVGRHLGVPVHVHRVSDLQSPYVGECEMRIARAFKHAQDKHALLVMDEVDTFLTNREKAQRSWEVSQTNEFLTQLETFEGLFFATTNLIHNLDPAAMRRFDLKLLFDYLKPGQSLQLLQRHCRLLRLRPTAPDASRLQQCAYLTPGDFANVAAQHRLTPIRSASEFVDRLLNEVHFKPVPRDTRRPVGFHAA